jgi:hypothetical protein
VEDVGVTTRRKDGETFAEVIERVKAQPPRGPHAPVGRHGDYWGDPDNVRFELVTDRLSPADARKLARQGAAIVYDACGCGGDECDLDWLTRVDVERITASGPPVLHPSKHGRADLEHWHSAHDGKDLIVAAVQVSWGDRIRG